MPTALGGKCQEKIRMRRILETDKSDYSAMRPRQSIIMIFLSPYLDLRSSAFPSPSLLDLPQPLPPSCFTNFACVASDLPLLRSSRPHTATSCQQLCASTNNCRQFTHYDHTVTPRLANSCWLFAKCEQKRRGCRGCTSGPPSCGLTCPLPQETRGGAWWCKKNSTLPPQDFDSCHFSCGGNLVSSTCLAGHWDRDLGDASTFSCPCQAPAQGPQLSCTSPGPPYPGGTVCASSCDPDLVTTCNNGGWSRDLSRSSCPEAPPPDTMLLVTSILSFLTTIVIVVRSSYSLYKYLRTNCRRGTIDCSEQYT